MEESNVQVSSFVLFNAISIILIAFVQFQYLFCFVVWKLIFTVWTDEVNSSSEVELLYL